MRVFLLALMIALLPLRGWVGDAMAVQQGHCIAMKNIANNPDSTGAEGHFDTKSGYRNSSCPDAVGSVEHPNTDDASAPDAARNGQCGNSGDCLILQIAGAVTAAQAQAPAAPSDLRWSTGSVSFASISPAPSLKPPIA